MSVICEQSLPYLLKDRTFRQSPSRQAISRALKYIDRWRQWMYQTFRQASLSDYFHGLSLIGGTAHVAPHEEDSLFFPVRRLNPDSLLLPNGGSIFESLGRLADLIVVEDVDLTPELLLDHLRGFGLNDLAASDATDRVRMQSAHLLCVTRRPLETALPGRRLW